MSLSVAAILRDTNSFISQHRKLVGMIFVILLLQIPLKLAIKSLGFNFGGALISTFFSAGAMGILVYQSLGNTMPAINAFGDVTQKHFAKILILGVIAAVIEAVGATTGGAFSGSSTPMLITILQALVSALFTVLGGWVLFSLYAVIAKGASSEEAIQRGASVYFKNIVPILIAGTIVSLPSIILVVGWTLYITSHIQSLIAQSDLDGSSVQNMMILTSVMMPIITLVGIATATYYVLMSYQLSKKLLGSSN